MSDTEDDLAEEAFAHEQELLAREAALAAADAAQEAAEAEEAERQAKRARHGDAAGSSLPRGDAAGSSWERASRTQCGGWLERVKVPVGCKETKGKWAFQTCCWRDARFECIELQKCYRTGDPILLNALHELRRGHASHPAVQRLVQATQRPLPPRGDGIKPTVLYATKKAVEAENRDELRRLDPATEHVYKALDCEEPDLDSHPPPDPNPNISPNERQKFAENCAAPDELQLRLGAQVMLIKNEVVSLAADVDPACRRAAHRSRLDWAAATDEETSRTYYYRVSNPSEVVWEKPHGDEDDATLYPEAQPLWWHAVLDPRLPAGWKDLYRRQPHFRRWERLRAAPPGQAG
ncbi:DNA helicase [Emiliania huxleyi CCMP1516]|uniref:DNA helicase n=2 Tax=Emiliania huxleyi TaxID=2903 RepID=A0A0D3JIU2_EMIH1|nr:DNA helicase [Emiliania huxleyi CCMP1516]EOD23427.1 DNA helicase [Emiliania huxleyi CCMP1516]|eukprot:XP_005775856.1 DNA helicase [Emiliania huxleyi CCMP1516]